MNDIDLEALTGPKKARVEIIPLIDVIFFLLATFVLFTLSLNKITSITTEFPRPTPYPEAVDQTLYLQASTPGTFYWKEGRTSTPELLSTSEIAPRLADYRHRVSRARVLIRGDDKAKFGAAVNLFDAVRKAGISQVSVETIVGSTGS